MTIMDLFWLFFILTALQPVLHQKMLESARARKVAQIEKQHGSRVILMVHRQETMGFLGFPLMRFINMEDSEQVMRAIHMTDPDTPIDLILHTPGGLVLASLQIARAIKQHRGKVTVYVPHYAMSGGTLISLAADEIVMSPHAVLGPVDPQLGEFPAASIVKVAEEKPLEHVDDKTLLMADVGRKAIQQVEAAVRELLGGTLPDDQAAEVAHRLATGTWTHDYPITPDAARELGLKVRTDIPESILELMALYPQPQRQQQSVEYLPVPRGFRGRHPHAT